MYEKDINRINKKIKKLEKLKHKLDYHTLLSILNKIKKDNTINNLSKNELQYFIYSERLNYALNCLYLSLKVYQYATDYNTHPKADYYQLSAQYVFDFATSPLGYKQVGATYNWMKEIDGYEEYKDLNLFDYVIKTMDVDNPIFKAYFNEETEPKLVEQMKKWHEYFILRSKYDYCHDYCLKQVFSDEIDRYEPFTIDKKYVGLTYHQVINHFNIADFEKTLNHSFIKTL